MLWILALLTDGPEQRRALKQVHAETDVATVPMVLELMRFQREGRTRDALWSWVSARAGVSLKDHDAALQWLWAQEYTPHADYAAFKAELYGAVDPRFRQYFAQSGAVRVRLDEVRWGGVLQDGIPPLRDPRLETVDQASSWLADDHVVFGVELNGIAQAFPKRIMAWHELLTATIGGEPVVGVYCSLCGSLIVYGTRVGDTQHELGTSGFLYRSNKLMYDAATQSLWSTLQGTPVIGPLAVDPVQLPMFPVVTTTWGAWRERHPDTQVLSLQTGHERDYGEGVAYRSYFATDELMFTVPEPDARLKNKAQVLALSVGGERAAISKAFLATHPIHHETLGGQGLVVLTDPSGAARVYDVGSVRVVTLQGAAAVDALGRSWTVTEAALTHGEERLQRVAAHQVFWFGWNAAFPDARLVR